MLGVSCTHLSAKPSIWQLLRLRRSTICTQQTLGQEVSMGRAGRRAGERRSRREAQSGFPG